ncbi:hypothetical protein Plec18167_006266 [Paecilomyces lecythidis]|uniref:Fatty acid hydroxylase domain-containing protein n=1 Tax=Paecilomyces lecythidis TaxID=3004212 RepID=A0ABR3XDQ3_9EURO
MDAFASEKIPQILNSVQQAWRQTTESYSPQTIEFVGTLIVQLLFFWVISFIYLSLDAWAPSFSHRHKIQPIPRQPSKREIWQCARVVARNQIMSATFHLAQIYISSRTRGVPSSYRVEPSFPSLPEIAVDLVGCFLMREIMFYYVHRIFHNPKFYGPIHKQHHRFTAPMALAAQYAHPFEHVVANALPISLPPQLLGSHIITFWIFLAYELFETATVHSGYDFFYNLAKTHDVHHEKFNLNYGTIGLLDWFHGTDKLKAKKRVD